MSIMNKKLICLIILTCLLCQDSFPQGFRIKDFQQSINDGSAFHSPMDAEGHPCGLVKVRSDNPKLVFRGNIVGNVENKLNEYWVYMPQGSKQLNILHPNFLPMNIDFDVFGIGEISPKTTYVLTLSEQKYNKEKTALLATIKPETAALYIDDVFIENLSDNGLYQLFLPKGDHVCRIEQKGYRPFVQVVTTGKSLQNLYVELESVMAELEVKCKTSTAEIYIDSELKGNGIWKGSMFAGEHQIEARQKNYETIIQTISLAEKECRYLTIPELNRSKIWLNIKSIPSEIPFSLMVDGKLIGKTPCKIEVATGSHKIECNGEKGYGYMSNVIRENIDIGEEKDIIIELAKVEPWPDIFKDAYNGDEKAISYLAFKQQFASFDEKQFWACKLPNIDYLINHIEINVPLNVDNVGDDYYVHEKAFKLALLVKPDKAYQALLEAENKGAYSYPDKNSDYWASLGSAYRNQQLFIRAISCYKIACERNDKNADYWESLGDLYKHENNKREAFECYKKSIGLLEDFQYDNKKKVEKKMKELGY